MTEVVAILFAIGLALLVAEAKGLIVAGVDAVLHRAAARLPEMHRERYREEWAAEALALSERPLSTVLWAGRVMIRTEALRRALETSTASAATASDDEGSASTDRSAAAVTEELAFELAGGPYAVTASRLALAGLERRLPDDVVFDIRLLVSELVTNAGRHGRMRDGDDSILLALAILDDHVRVEVFDDGPGFPDGFRAPCSEAQAEAGEGWGLFLVDQLADRWGIGEGPGGRVWFEVGRDRLVKCQSSTS